MNFESMLTALLLCLIAVLPKNQRCIVYTVHPHLYCIVVEYKIGEISQKQFDKRTL